MSLLLDALNKTSGQTKPADLEPPVSANDQPAPATGDRPVPSAISSRELTLEAQDLPPSIEAESHSLDDEAEIDVDVDFDEAEFSALLDEEDELILDVEHAATEAVFDGDAISALDSIDELSDEIANLSSIPPLAETDAQVSPERSVGDNQTNAGLETANLETSVENTPSKTADDVEAVEHTPELSIEDSSGHLIIDAQAEPETLAEEVLQDAPLVQAYSQAQKKRRQILLLIACAIFVMACAVIYKLAFAETSVQENATNFDPVTQQIEESAESKAVLEEVNPDSIPERLSMPEFSSADDVLSNKVIVEPARSASQELRRAYIALNQGSLDQAERLYLKLSKTEVSKAPALSGLASVAIARNQTDNARAHLQHILSIDRHHAWAASTLAALPTEESGISPPNGSSLSQLKNLRSAEPGNHQIAYLLGNKFAAAGIWTEAQSAYFDAFALDSQNANYAFNLAIALDHLGKAKEAKNFYLQALQLAETKGADFNIASLRKRLQRGDR